MLERRFRRARRRSGGAGTSPPPPSETFTTTAAGEARSAGKRGLDEEVRRAEVDGEMRRRTRPGSTSSTGVSRKVASVVDDHVEPAAPARSRRRRSAARRGCVREVRRDDDGATRSPRRRSAATASSALPRGRRAPPSRPASAEQPGGRGADAGARTGDDGDAVVQAGPTILTARARDHRRRRADGRPDRRASMRSAATRWRFSPATGSGARGALRARARARRRRTGCARRSEVGGRRARVSRRPPTPRSAGRRRPRRRVAPGGPRAEGRRPPRRSAERLAGRDRWPRTRRRSRSRSSARRSARPSARWARTTSTRRS